MLQKTIIFTAFICLFACTKENTQTVPTNDPNPQIDEIPIIEILGLSKTEVHANADSLVFTISYIDGNGDLGTPDADEKSIELIDQRAAETLVFEYHLMPLTPESSMIAIQGELNIILDHTILLDDTNDSESTTFTIRIKDRAGNWSNVVETEEVLILK